MPDAGVVYDGIGARELEAESLENIGMERWEGGVSRVHGELEVVFYARSVGEG